MARHRVIKRKAKKALGHVAGKVVDAAIPFLAVTVLSRVLKTAPATPAVRGLGYNTSSPAYRAWYYNVYLPWLKQRQYQQQNYGAQSTYQDARCRQSGGYPRTNEAGEWECSARPPSSYATSTRFRIGRDELEQYRAKCEAEAGDTQWHEGICTLKSCSNYCTAICSKIQPPGSPEERLWSATYDAGDACALRTDPRTAWQLSPAQQLDYWINKGLEAGLIRQSERSGLLACAPNSLYASSQYCATDFDVLGTGKILLGVDAARYVARRLRGGVSGMGFILPGPLDDLLLLALEER